MGGKALSAAVSPAQMQLSNTGQPSMESKLCDRDASLQWLGQQPRLSRKSANLAFQT